MTTYEYDARGHLTRKTTPGSNVLTYTYDSAERLKDESHQDLPVKEFLYDESAGGTAAAGKMTTAKRHNRHTDLGDVVVTETFVYSGVGGRLSSKTTAVSNGPSFTDSYTYDPFGNLVQVGYPNCTNCGGLAPPARTVTNVFEGPYLRRVAGYTSQSDPIGFHPNGLLRRLRHVNADGTNGPLYEQQIATNGMPRPSSIALTGYCTDLRITTHPPATKEVSQGEPANITVAANGATSYEWYRLGETIPIATGQTLTVPVTATTTFWARAKSATCTVDSSVSNVTVPGSCPAPDATITAPTLLSPGRSASASVSAGASTYQWTVSGSGTLMPPTNQREVNIQYGCSRTATLNVVVTASCGTQATGSHTVQIASPQLAVTASPSSITAGQTATLTVVISGGGPGPHQIRWADLPGDTTVLTRAVSPATSTTYAITHFNGCPGNWGSATVTVAGTPPPAPTAVRADGLSANRVQVSWVYPEPADGFEIDRCSSNCSSPASWTTFVHNGASPFLDQDANPQSVHVYTVRAIRDGTSSANGNLDVGTTISFGEIIPRQTTIQVLHMTELRAAVNGMRMVAGLSPLSFAPLAGQPIRAIYFTELQAALNDARRDLGLPQVSFTAASGIVRDVHVTDIRGGVQ